MYDLFAGTGDLFVGVPPCHAFDHNSAHMEVPANKHNNKGQQSITNDCHKWHSLSTLNTPRTATIATAHNKGIVTPQQAPHTDTGEGQAPTTATRKRMRKEKERKEQKKKNSTTNPSHCPALLIGVIDLI